MELTGLNLRSVLSIDKKVSVDYIRDSGKIYAPEFRKVRSTSTLTRGEDMRKI